MSMSSSPLGESFPASRFVSPNPSPTRTEVDLPLEVDQSFNSSLSISDSPYFSPTPNCASKGNQQLLSPLSDSLSPPPANLFGAGAGNKPRRPDPVPLQRSESNESVGGDEKGTTMRPLGTARGFGRELSGNHIQARASGSTIKAGKGMMLPPAVPDKCKRGGLPMQWTSSNEENCGKLFQPRLARRDVSQPAVSMKMPADEADRSLCRVTQIQCVRRE